jgi:hypothetical protein
MPTFADLRPVPTVVGCAGRDMGWTDVGVLITPCVPGGHALPEQRDVLVVRHGSTPEVLKPFDQLAGNFEGSIL